MNNNLQKLDFSDVYEFIEVIDSVINILQKERRITRHIVGGKINSGLIELNIPENLVIVGDLHGDLRSLQHILKEIDYENFLSNHSNKLIFLGDYVDRGNHSIGVLYTVCYLKRKYPNSVILMRGNHEAHMEFPFSSHDLPLKIIEYFGDNYEKAIHGKISTLFQLLYLVTIIQNKLWLVHGGLPTEIEYKDFEKLIETAQSYNIHKKSLEELLWNDPRTIQNGGNWEKSRRMYGKHFGINITKKWLTMSRTKVIVRGHEPCNGFKIDHDDKILTLFSCKEAYPKFEAAHIFISKKQLEKIHNAVDLVPFVRK
ncbi:MAG TPA: metallophosphoesterase family protein [Nitrosopumilaceae archaeon]|nr:metallophosphoesterase family protein [Nitrosopumilaceae archaeon]